MLMLLGPTLVMACLVGGRPSAFLSVLLAIGTEAAESAFGYGFDLLDAVDLICDGAGIILGLWIHKALLGVARKIPLPRYVACLLHLPSLPRHPS